MAKPIKNDLLLTISTVSTTGQQLPQVAGTPRDHELVERVNRLESENGRLAENIYKLSRLLNECPNCHKKYIKQIMK
jgi:hypothetical protein